MLRNTILRSLLPRSLRNRIGRRTHNRPIRSRTTVETLEDRIVPTSESLLTPGLMALARQLEEGGQPEPLAVLPLQEAAAPLLDGMGVDSAAGATQAAARVHEVVFIDAAVSESDELIGALHPHATVVHLAADRDGVKQMAEFLGGHMGVSEVHVISHGGPGAVQLGSVTLDAMNLDRYASEFATIKGALSEEADLLLYGCDVAAGMAGVSFVARLSALTGADVAASTTPTGAAEKGGDWRLEEQTGTIEAMPLADVIGSDGLLNGATAVTVTSTQSVVNAGQTAVITFSFPEAPAGFAAEDVRAGGGTLSNLAVTADPAVYTASFTPTPGYQGTGFVAVLAGSYTDSLGNPGGGGGLDLSVDALAPSVTVSADVTNGSWLRAGQTVALTFTFSEPVSGFAAGDIDVTQGSLSNLAATANPKVYTATFTPLANVQGPQGRVQVRPNSYTDTAGNLNPNWSNYVYWNLDTTVPTVAVTADRLTLAAGETAALTFRFSEPPTGFTASDVTGSGGTLSGFSATSDPLVYTATFVPVAGYNGWASVAVPDACYTDARNNPGVGNLLWLRVGDLAFGTDVTVSSNRSVVNAGQTAVITFSFPEAPAGFAAEDVRAGGGTLSNLAVTADPAVYTATFTPTPGYQGTGFVAVLAGSYTDSLGNPGGGGGLDLSVDALAPSVTVSADVPNWSWVRAGQTVALTFTFSEPVSGFAVGDLYVSQGSVSNLTATANPKVYTATFTPLANVQGNQAQVYVPSNRYTDAADNLNPASSNSVYWYLDTLRPTVAVIADRLTLPAGESAALTFRFSEAPVGFAAADVLTTGGTLSGLAVTSDPQVYTATFTPTVGYNGWASVAVPDACYTDSRNNSGDGNLLWLRFGNWNLGVLINSNPPPTSVLRTGQSATLTLTFSSAPQELTAEDITATGGAVSDLAPTSDPLVYTAAFTPDSNFEGTATVSLPAGSYTDPAGTPGTGGSINLRVDTVSPTVTVTTSAATLKAGATANLTFTFSEAPAGFTSGDLNVSGGAVSSLASTGDPLVYTATFTPTAHYEGSATVSVAAGAYTDLAGNSGAAGSVGLSIDTLAPTATLSYSGSTPVRSSTVTVGVSFSEPVSGFTETTDLEATNATVSAVNSLGGNAYSFLLHPLAPGLVTVRVKADAARDVVENPNPTSATLSLQYEPNPLQDRIDAAAPGDTLLIAPGNYIGVVIDKNLTLRASGPGVVIQGASPALTILDGEVRVENGIILETSSNAPTVLVAGGNLKLRESTVRESDGFEQAAIRVAAGNLDLGTASATDPGGNVLEVRGTGLAIDNQAASAIPALGNTFRLDTVDVNSGYRIEDLVRHKMDTDLALDDTGLVRWEAENVYVTEGGSDHSIQRGIDAAEDGDTVNVEAGIYVENVVIHRPVELAGAGQNLVYLLPEVSALMVGAGSSLPPGASNVILVQASGVTIHDLTIDGDNPSLTSGVVRNGADLDARNGIITNNRLGRFDGLDVHDTTVRNIYLRGIYASSGGTFDFQRNLVENVQGEYASIGIFNFGGAGIIKDNTVRHANDGIAANHSRGTSFLGNTVEDSGTGIHTDNSGDSAGSADDLIQDNIISNSSYGVFVFVPYQAVTVERNQISGADVGLSAFGGAGGSAAFSDNVVNSINPGGFGAVVSTDQLGYDTGSVSASFTNNSFTGGAVGLYVEEPQAPSTPGSTASVLASGNTFSDATLAGIEMIGGSVSLTQNRVEGNAIGILVEGGTLVAAEENVVTGSTGDGIKVTNRTGPYLFYGIYYGTPGNATTTGQVGSIFNNDLSGNTGYAVNNTTSTTVDASGNWWGVNTDPAVAGLSNGPVDYTPWLDNGADVGSDPSNGFQGDFSSLHVSAASPQVGSVGRIQEAVNAVADGLLTGNERLVDVKDGSYLESDITIQKGLRVIGQSEAGVIVAPAVPDGQEDNSWTNAHYAFLLQTGDVTISNLTIDGQGNTALGSANNYRGGVMTDHRLNTPFDNITVQDVTIQNTSRRGIQIFPGTAAARRSTGHLIDGNTISNVTYGPAIVFFDAEGTISNNEISGTPSAIESVEWSQSGGAAVTISGNTIHHLTASPYGSGATGIQVVEPAAGTLIRDNHIDLTLGSALPDVGVIVRNATGSVTVQNNEITAEGKDAGLWLFGNAVPVRVALNTLTSSGSTAAALGEGRGVFLSDDGSLFTDGDGNPVANLPGSAVLTDNRISGFALGVDVASTGGGGGGGKAVSATIGEVGHGNTISGAAIGVRVFNAPSVTGASASADIASNLIHSCGSGIELVNGGYATEIDDNDFGSAAGDPDNGIDLMLGRTAGVPAGGYVLNNNRFAGSTYFIDNESPHDILVLAADGNSFFDDAGGAVTDHFRIEDRVSHKVDDLTLGLASWVANNIYVTNSGSDGSIQRGVDAAGDGYVVNVEAGGWYSGNVDATAHAVTLAAAGEGVGTVYLDGRLILDADNTLAFEIKETGYDQWVIPDWVTYAGGSLGNAALHVAIDPAYSPDPSSVFTLLDTWGFFPFTGQFAGFADDSLATVDSGQTVWVDYTAHGGGYRKLDLSLNLPPTAVAVTPSSVERPENSQTGSDIEMAVVTTTDDAGGSVSYSLSGPDRHAFFIDASDPANVRLYLYRDAPLDFETYPVYQVTVNAYDPSLSAPPVSAAFTLTLSDVDEIPPVVISTVPPDGGTIYGTGFDQMTVTFDEPLREESAEDVRNYRLEDPSGNAIPILAAELDGTTVTLTFATQSISGEYNLRVTGVEDELGNAMPQMISSYVTPAETYSLPIPYWWEGEIPSTLGDFDDDGNLDLIVQPRNTNSLYLYRGRGDGTFAPAAVVATTSGNYVEEMRSADLDSDGKLDLILGEDNTGIGVYFGNGDGTFQPRQVTAASTNWGLHGLAVADLDGNGYLDVACTDHGYNSTDGGHYRVLAALNDGTRNVAGWATQDSLRPVYYGDGDLYLTDVTGDGRLDAVVAEYGYYIRVGVGDGSGLFSSWTSANTGIYHERYTALADLDGDGRLDLASGYDGGYVTWGTAAAPYFGTTQYLGMNSGSNMQAADLDDDGDIDLVSGDYDGRVWVAFNEGDRHFTTKLIDLRGQGMYSIWQIQTGDLDGDGLPELIGTANTSVYGLSPVFVLRPELVAPAATFALNLPPQIVSVSAPDTNEGSDLVLSVVAADTEHDPLSYVWEGDRDGDGTFEADLGHAASVTVPTVDGPQTWRLRVRVSDGHSEVVSAPETVEILNVAPALNNLAVTPSVAEGGSVTLTGSIFDPGQDTFDVFINWGDGSALERVPRDATGSFSVLHRYDDDNPTGTPIDLNTVRLYVQDSDGAASPTATLPVFVSNAPPTLSEVRMSDPMAEGGEARLTGRITDLSPLGTATETFTLLIDWGDGSAPQTVPLGTSRTFDIPHTYADNSESGSYLVTVVATDDDGGQCFTATTQLVGNAVPTLDAGADRNIREGDEVSLAPATFFDPGRLDTHEARIDWGDGTPVEPGLLSSSVELDGVHGTISGSHVYADSGIYHVKVSVRDADMAPDAWVDSFFDVFVENVAPTVGGVAVTSPVSENGVATLSGTIGGAANDTFTLTINWGDGSPPETFTYAAGTTSFTETHQYLDDNPSGTPGDGYTISGSLADDDGDSASLAPVVTVVNNTAPGFDSLSATSVVEGGLVHLTGTYHDAGALDTHRLEISWGDGSDPEYVTVAGGVFDLTHQYLDDTDLAGIRVRLTDDDGGETNRSIDVNISNAAPTVYAGGYAAIREGETFSRTGYFTDPGSGPKETWEARVDYGDGSGEQELTLNPDGTFDLSHVYADTGVYQVRVTVHDDDMAHDEWSDSFFDVFVGNVAPAVAVNSDVTALDEGQAVHFTASVTESGQDVLGYFWDFGDGQTSTLQNPTHTYADNGVYTARCTVTDADGAVGTDAVLLSVANVAPLIAEEHLAHPDPLKEGDELRYSMSFEDAGLLDGHTVQIDWGDGSLPVALHLPAGVLTTGELYHTYRDNGTYLITPSVADDDGGSDILPPELRTEVTVLNVRPSIAVSGSATVPEGAVYTLTLGPISDRGADTVSGGVVYWGDGNSTPFMAGTSHLTHVYDGVQTDRTIRVNLTDEDGLHTDRGNPLMVSVENVAPTLSAGGNRSVAEGALLTLGPATFFDPGVGDTHEARIVWGDGSTESGIVSMGPDGIHGTVSGSHVYADSGIYHVKVSVRDAAMAPDAWVDSFFDVFVENAAPTLTIPEGYAHSVAEGAELAFTAVAGDTDLPPPFLTFSLVGAPAGATLVPRVDDPRSADFRWTPTEAQGPASYTFWVRVSDGLETVEREVHVSVREVNQNPTLTLPGGPLTVTEGEPIAFLAAGLDSDLPAQLLTYSLVGGPGGAFVDPLSGRFSWTPGESDGAAGGSDHNVTIRVTDALGRYDEESLTITVNEANVPPVLAYLPPQSVAEGLELSLAIRPFASDADLPANALAFSLQGASHGAAIDPTTGLFRWTPTEAQGPGSYSFTVRVTDASGLYDERLLLVSVGEQNEAPILTLPTLSAGIAEGQTLAFTATAADVDVPAGMLRFSLIGAPLGAVIDPVSGEFTWTPGEGHGGGSWSFTIRVTDPAGAFDEEEVTVAVAEVNAPPVLTGVPVSWTAAEMTPIVFQATANDPDTPPAGLRYYLIGAPAGAVINPDTGQFSWTPSEVQGPGGYTFEVAVGDDQGLNDRRTMSVAVTEANRPPVVTPAGPFSIPEGERLVFQVSANDPDLPAQDLLFALSGSQAGVVFDPLTGRFEWTPSDLQGPGDYSFSVTARDSDGALSDPETILVHVGESNRVPILNPIAAQTVPEGAPCTFTASATDPDYPAQALTFALDGAPLGASIDPNTGVFTWTPAETQGPGVFDFSVIVRDTEGLEDRQSVRISVTEVDSPTDAFQDAFARPDSGDVGAPWRARLGDYVLAAQRLTGQAGGLSLATVDGLWAADVSVQAEVTLSQGRLVGVVARCSGSDDRNTYWAGLVNWGKGPAVEIWKNTNGLWTKLAHKAVGKTSGVIRLDVTGTQLRLFLNSKQKLRVVDSAPLGAGYVGVRSEGGVIDNFAAVKLLPAPLPFLDQFERPGALLPGAYWTQSKGGFALQAGRLDAAPASMSMMALNTANLANVRVEAQVSVAAAPTSTVSLMARYGSGTGNMYVGQLELTAQGYKASILAKIGGMWYVLGSSAVDTGAGRLRFEVVGDQLQLYFNDALVVQGRDGRLSGGQVGIRGKGSALADFAATVL